MLYSLSKIKNDYTTTYCCALIDLKKINNIPCFIS